MTSENASSLPVSSLPVTFPVSEGADDHSRATPSFAAVPLVLRYLVGYWRWTVLLAAVFAYFALAHGHKTEYRTFNSCGSAITSS